MIVVMDAKATQREIEQVKSRLKELGFQTHVIMGVKKQVIGAVGDKSIADAGFLELLPGVEKVMPVLKPYKLVSREAKPEGTIIEMGNLAIGGENIVVMAGPCAVESREQIVETARAVKEAGAQILRGGAFKPRSSPYSFQGLGIEGLKYLREAAEETGMLVVTEVLDSQDIPAVSEYSDILQIGARNMQNFRLLRAAGKQEKPVLLKRGLAATIEEWLMAAEYIMCEGNYRIILCERGIRTFENSTRNTLDISAVPLVKRLSHLPVVVDPSHASGKWYLVAPLAKASLAAGADGLLIEVHPRPEEARSDGAQSLTPENFKTLMEDLKKMAPFLGRRLDS